jgi:hypothetical protein
MKEQNIERAVAICKSLEKCRKKINVINSVKRIDSYNQDVEIRVFTSDNNNKSERQERIEVSGLGKEMMEWLIDREKLRIKGMIIELEAELKNL